MKNLELVLIVIGAWALYLWMKLSDNVPDSAIYICPVICLSCVGIPVYFYSGSWLWVAISLVMYLMTATVVYVKATK